MSENRKFKIAYIELDTHADILSNFYGLLHDSEIFGVSYFISDKISQQFPVQDSAIRVVNPSNVLQILQNENWDLVIIGTAHRYFNLFSDIITKFPTALIAHNLAFTSISKINLVKSLFKEDFFYRLKLLFKEGLLSVHSVFKNAKVIFVLDEKLGNKQCQFLPVFYIQTTKKSTSGYFTVVVPGAVSQKRRDYKRILNQVSRFGQPTKIILLGKAQGEELRWIEEAKKRVPKHVQLKYFTKKVPQEEYDGLLRSADVLWCPIQIDTEFFSNDEKYGITKVSGNIGDAIKFATPAIFPKAYETNYPFIFSEVSDIESQLHSVSNTTIDWSLFARNTVKERLEYALLKAINSY